VKPTNEQLAQAYFDRLTRYSLLHEDDHAFTNHYTKVVEGLYSLADDLSIIAEAKEPPVPISDLLAGVVASMQDILKIGYKKK
jgi:hypothetical protein